MNDIINKLEEDILNVYNPNDSFAHPTEQKIPIRNFIDYFKRRCGSSEYEIIYTIKLMYRFMERLNHFINRLNVHKLFLVSFILSYKLIRDRPIKNTWYSTVTNLNINVLNELEKEFLTKLDWDIYISV